MTDNHIMNKPNKPKIKVIITKKKTVTNEQVNNADANTNEMPNKVPNELISQTEDELLENIIKQYLIANKFTLPDIILQESPTDCDLQKRIVNTYFKLITLQLNINLECKINLDCKINTAIDNDKANQNIIDWNTLRKYQKEYILEVIGLY